MFVTKCYAFLCVIDLNTDSPNTIHSHLFFVACIIQLCITIKIILTSDWHPDWWCYKTECLYIWLSIRTIRTDSHALWLLIAPTSDRKECISGALYTQINSDLRTRFTNTASSSHSGSSVFHQMTFKETASLHASPSFGILFFFLPRLVKVQLKCAGLLPASNDLSGRPLFVMAFKLGTIYWCFYC